MLQQLHPRLLGSVEALNLRLLQTPCVDSRWTFQCQLCTLARSGWCQLWALLGMRLPKPPLGTKVSLESASFHWLSRLLYSLYLLLTACCRAAAPLGTSSSRRPSPGRSCSWLSQSLKGQVHCRRFRTLLAIWAYWPPWAHSESPRSLSEHCLRQLSSSGSLAAGSGYSRCKFAWSRKGQLSALWGSRLSTSCL